MSPFSFMARQQLAVYFLRHVKLLFWCHVQCDMNFGRWDLKLLASDMEFRIQILYVAEGQFGKLIIWKQESLNIVSLFDCAIAFLVNIGFNCLYHVLVFIFYGFEECF
ncbi:hypothetical protein ACJX0J_026897, partial [Zea mays]